MNSLNEYKKINIKDKYKRREKTKNYLLIKIPKLFSCLLLIIIILILIYKENKFEKLKNKKNYLKNYEIINKEFKKIIEFLTKWRNEINFDYNKLIYNNNYNFTQYISNFIIKLEELQKSKSRANLPKDNGERPITINNYNSTLKSQYFTIFENIFFKYRNETELSDAYKTKFKAYLLKECSSLFKRKYSKINIIIFSRKMNFGNAIFVINNLIYFCEILDCKKIYLSKYYWFVKKAIYDKELNITIAPLNIDTWDNSSTINFDRFHSLFRLFKYFFIPVRTYILKNEIFSNIKLINTNKEDLYINIRSGKDIFVNHGKSIGTYFQPPLCFYKTIIEIYNFRKIYLVSNGKENPVVNELLKSYNNIKYFHGTVKEDVAIILSAKNFVLACSSFSVELIKLSDNLQNLFEFNLMSSIDRNYWHFYDRHLRPLKFNRFIMNPTQEYIKIMKPWRQSKKQFSQMIKEKCIKKFTIVPSDFA